MERGTQDSALRESAEATLQAAKHILDILTPPGSLNQPNLKHHLLLLTKVIGSILDNRGESLAKHDTVEAALRLCRVACEHYAPFQGDNVRALTRMALVSVRIIKRLSESGQG